MAVEDDPKALDEQEMNYHQTVIDSYNLMLKEAAVTLGEAWSEKARGVLRRRYHSVVDEWTVYRVALNALHETEGQERGLSIVEAHKLLKEPRREYLNALEQFVDEMSDAIDGLSSQVRSGQADQE